MAAPFTVQSSQFTRPAPSSSPFTAICPPFAEKQFRGAPFARIVTFIPDKGANMTHEMNNHWRKQLVWGILLIVVGGLFLLDRLDMLDLDIDLSLRHVWHYWPWLLVAFGVNDMIPPTSARLFMDGLWKICFAIWWYISFEQLWGLSFGDTWPALLILWGLGLMMQPLVRKHYTQREQ